MNHRSITKGLPIIALGARLVLMPSPSIAQGAKPLTKCAPDAVASGTVCMDRYEASVWRLPDPLGANKGLVKKIQKGKAKAADLAKGGATQLGVASDDYAPCLDSSVNCPNDIFAVSIPGVPPSAWLTWFQAQAACENVAKRLPSNAEWQAAVMGTPDPGPDDGVADCNTTNAAATPTGSRTRCVSTRGAFDMVGNLGEWVADWVPRSTGCGIWSSDVDQTGDAQCLIGAAATGEPGVLLRGGDFVASGEDAGPLAVIGFLSPSFANDEIGVRCAR